MELMSQEFILINKEQRVFACYWSHACINKFKFNFFDDYQSQAIYLKKSLENNCYTKSLKLLKLLNTKTPTHKAKSGQNSVIILDNLQYPHSDNFSALTGQTLSESCVTKSQYGHETGRSTNIFATGVLQ